MVRMDKLNLEFVVVTLASRCTGFTLETNKIPLDEKLCKEENGIADYGYHGNRIVL